MRRSCQIHAHILLLQRNISEDELNERNVERILSSFAFLSLHHTFNADLLSLPEPELFEIFHHHRRGLERLQTYRFYVADVKFDVASFILVKQSHQVSSLECSTVYARITATHHTVDP